MKTVQCPRCRQENAASAAFCSVCGMQLPVQPAAGAQTQAAQPQYRPAPSQPQGAYLQEPAQQQWQGAPGTYPQTYGQAPYGGYAPQTAQPMTKEGAKAQTFEALRIRAQTDRVLSPILILLPIAAIIVTIIIAIVAFIIAFPSVNWVTDPQAAQKAADAAWWGIIITIAGSIVAEIIIAILIYMLIERRNQHFRRESMLRHGMLGYLKARTDEKGISQLVAADIASMQSVTAEADARDDQKSALLYVILTIIPVVGFFISLYILYFLTKDPQEHDRRWQFFASTAQRVGSQAGMVTVMPSWKALEQRNFVLYFILAIVTFGIFLIYWYYTLFRDLNEHFRAQWQFEDSFAAAMT